MQLLGRIAAVLVAAVLYVAVWYLANLVVLALATIFEFDVPGHHGSDAPGWWGWLWSLVWVFGLLAVVWWVGVRMPRRRKKRLSDSIASS